MKQALTLPTPPAGIPPPPGGIPKPVTNPGILPPPSDASSVGFNVLKTPSLSKDSASPKPKLEPLKSIPKPGKAGFGIKIALGKTAPSLEPAPTVKPTVAKVFGGDDSSDEEEIPEEARMKMRNIGRQTVTSSGPNSFIVIEERPDRVEQALLLLQRVATLLTRVKEVKD